ncbi:hypothetical protein FHX42_001209 [Saccharopolyspora lacisalsi]|uniref:Uncharacterized protein n=1 Tax=Halosaccharopolyspora lacisalsi TaxID=1000566 RepID=A0A839DSE5_9PSEU|nr:hypothetical protein [Halosaccharopolyspora lacisalsi]
MLMAARVPRRSDRGMDSEVADRRQARITSTVLAAPVLAVSILLTRGFSASFPLTTWKALVVCWHCPAWWASQHCST